MDPRTGEIKSYLPEFQKPNEPRAVSPESQDTIINRVQSELDGYTKDFRAARSGSEVLTGALQANTAVGQYAMLDALSRVVNPGAIVRPTTLEILKESASWPDKARRMASVIATGKWPQDMQQQLAQTVNDIMREHVKTANQARNDGLKRLRRAGITDGEDYIHQMGFSEAGLNAPRTNREGSF